MSVIPVEKLVGQKFEGRLIDELLRNRTCNWTYLATDPATGGRFMLRITDDDGGGGTRAEQIVASEHPGIVSYSETGERSIGEMKIGSDETEDIRVHYFFRRFLTHCLKDQPATTQQRGHWKKIRDLIAGLRTLHTLGLPHGDIRPSNILSDDNESWLLADPVLGSATADLLSANRMHTSGYYYAPELLYSTSDRPVSLKTDVYSFGVVLAELLGIDLAPERSVREIARMNDDLRRRISYGLSGKSPHINRILIACLDEKPSCRPTIEDIHVVVDELGFVDQDRRFVRRVIDRSERVVQMLETPAIAEMVVSRLLEAEVSNLAKTEEIRSAVETSVDESIAALNSEGSRFILLPNVDATARYLYTRSLVLVIKLIHARMGTERKEDAVSEEEHVNFEVAPFLEGIDGSWMSAIFDRFEERQRLVDEGDAPEAVLADLSLEPSELIRQMKTEVGIASKVRQELLGVAECMTTDALVSMMKRSEIVVSPDDLRKMVEMDELFAVTDYDHFLFPRFQFDPASGAIFEIVPMVTKIFDLERNGWGLLSWWFRENPALQGDQPSDLVGDEARWADIVQAAQHPATYDI